MKRAIVIALERACEVVDILWGWPRPFCWIAQLLGCPSGLALWSAQLDERWGTDVWRREDAS